jgi:ADP-ribose pyrophosphatase YjhB (NUDIX family)
MKKAYTNGEHDLRRGVDFIGVTCSFVCHDGNGRILLHKRSQNCRDEQGRWDNGGGAHEFGDSLEETVRREIKEEYGVDPLKLELVTFYETHRQLDDGTPTHWLAVMYAAQVDPKQVKNNEPYKIDEIGWFSPDALPTPAHTNTEYNLTQVRAAGIL